MSKQIYKKQKKMCLMLDLSNDCVNNIYKTSRSTILKKEVKRVPHFTFMTIVFNNKYRNVVKFLKNKKHLNNIKKLVLLYYEGCVLKPSQYSLLGLDEKKFYTKEFELNNKCIKKITLSRQIIYNYIALNIMYNKETANKLFINYIKDNKSNKKLCACSNFINKNNKKFVKFIYKDKTKNKTYDLFSVPEHSFNTNKLTFHISITDTDEIERHNSELYNKLNTENMLDKLNDISSKKNIRWNNIYINSKSKFIIGCN
tara:strand:- start:31 stop:801 length:771 start_codon:yes stop_codon:yes gene_type:complete